MVCVPPSARDLRSDTMNQQNLASDIWNIADTLRGDSPILGRAASCLGKPLVIGWRQTCFEHHP